MCPFFRPLIFTPSQRVGDGVRAGPRGSALTVVLLLSPGPLSLHTMHGATPSSSTELLLFTFLAGGVFLTFLPAYLFQSGSGSLLFFFTSCQFKMHIPQCGLGGRSFSSPRWPGGSLRVGNCGTLTIQLHHDRWGKSGLGTSACPSFALS